MWVLSMTQWRSYRMLRGFQISLVFTVTIFLQMWLHLPHAGWAGFAVMMIYGGFDNGTCVERAYQRFFGLLFGLLLGYCLWFIGHVDYRTVFFIIPVLVFSVFFWAGTAFAIPTTFTVASSIIGFGYFNSQSEFLITFFLLDYAMCTIIGFCCILVFERWFSHYGMMVRFVHEVQQDVFNHMCELVDLLNHERIYRVDWIKCSGRVAASMFEMDRLMQNNEFLINARNAVGDEINQFVELSHILFVHLKALYIANYMTRSKKIDDQAVRILVQEDLIRLNQLLIYDEGDAASSEGKYAELS